MCNNTEWSGSGRKSNNGNNSTGSGRVNTNNSSKVTDENLDDKMKRLAQESKINFDNFHAGSRINQLGTESKKRTIQWVEETRNGKKNCRSNSIT